MSTRGTSTVAAESSVLECEASAGSRAKGSSLLSAILNLLNTVVGGGILSLPFAFRSCGVAVGAAYILVFGAASWLGSLLLLDAMRYRPGARSYEDLARLSIGRGGARAYNFAALVNCYGACVSYMVAAADVIPPLLAEMGHDLGRSPVLIALTAVIIFPLSALRDISALQYASGVAILIYLAFAITLVCLAWGGASAPAALQAPSDAVASSALFKPDPAGWIRAIPICAFAFVHQTSVFPVYQELSEQSRRRMGTAVAAAIIAATALYLVAAFAASARFGEGIRGDILLNLAAIDSTSVRVVRLAFGLSLCLTYPVLHFPARRVLSQLLFNRADSRSADSGAGDPEAAAYATAAYGGEEAIGLEEQRTRCEVGVASCEGARRVPAASPAHEAACHRLLGLTCLLVGSSLCIALAVDHVESIFGFTGAVASTMLSYVLPASIHLRVRRHRMASLRKNGATAAFLVMGTVCGLVALVNHTIDVLA